MSAGWIGYVLGGFAAALLLSVILLMIFRFTPLKRNPAVAYGIAGVLAAVTPFVAVAGGGDALAALVSGALAACFLFWGYRRAVRKLGSS